MPVICPAEAAAAGNPMRLATGPLEANPDVEWKWTIRGRDRTAVTALSWPHLIHPGFRLFRRAPAASA